MVIRAYTLLVIYLRLGLRECLEACTARIGILLIPQSRNQCILRKQHNLASTLSRLSLLDLAVTRLPSEFSFITHSTEPDTLIRQYQLIRHRINIASFLSTLDLTYFLLHLTSHLSSLSSSLLPLYPLISALSIQVLLIPFSFRIPISCFAFPSVCPQSYSGVLHLYCNAFHIDLHYK